MSSDHDRYTHQILTTIGQGRPITQRALARELGVALGLTNLLVRRIVKKGWVKVTHVQANRVAYLLTPAGIAEKVHLTRAYFDNTIHLYTETRSRIKDSLQRLSLEWPPEAPSAGEKRIVFYGAGEVAEIGYVTLQETDLKLVGVVDDRPRQLFFGMPVHRPETLQAGRLNGEVFDRVVVMSFGKAEHICTRLESNSFPSEQVYVL